MKLREIPHRLRVAFKARDIYNLAHKLRARQLALEALLPDTPSPGDQAYRYILQVTPAMYVLPDDQNLADWHAAVSVFFNDHSDTLDRLAVWHDLEEAERLLTCLQSLYDLGGSLWDQLSA